jgi:hypothetical protein
MINPVQPADGEPSRAALALALLFFIVVWGAALAIGNAPFPILHDMSEAYVWGREFQLGYNQHPPFWAWICGLWFLVWPRTGWAFALLDTLNAAVGLAGAYALIGDFARGAKRIAAFPLLLLTPFYTFGCYKYDANTIFLSLWPWLAHLFVVSLRTRRGGVGLGALVALSLLSKYYALVLLAACGLAAVQTPLFWPWLRSAAPWIAALVAGLLCAPHGYWLLTHAAPPLQYLDSIAGRPFGAVVGDAARTALTSLACLLAALLAVVYFARGASAPSFAARWRREPELRLAATLALAPFALTLIAGVAMRVKLTPEMPIGGFALVPLLLIEALGPRDPGRLARASLRAAATLLFLMLALSPFVALGRLWLPGRELKIPPHVELAAEATRLWRAQVGTPLSFVAGGGLENAVVFYSPDRAHSFYDFDYAKNLWVTPARIATLGLTSVCSADDAACLAKTAGFATSQTQATRVTLAHRVWGFESKPASFVVTIIPPQR